jgi:hypothetical protein
MPKDEALEEKIRVLETEINVLNQEKQRVSNEINELNKKEIQIAEDKGLVYYIITFEARQTHFSLDISEHLKDAANAYTFQIPVDKTFYDSVSIGQEYTREFRAGSMLLKGTLGSNKITIVGKEKVLKR